jgi:hypothetical protein
MYTHACIYVLHIDCPIAGVYDIFSKEFSPSLLALLLISVAFGAADGFGMAEIKILLNDIV